MIKIREQLLQAYHELQQQIESPIELIDRLKQEGKSMGEIEKGVIELTRIQSAYDSVEMALRVLES